MFKIWSLLIPVCLVLCLAACSHSNVKNSPSRNVSGDDADPFAGNKGTLENPVLGEEYALPDEENVFQQKAQLIQQLQDKAVVDHKMPGPMRGFHAKVQGCFQARFTVNENVPERAKYGIFKIPQSYYVLVRLSSGVGYPQADFLPDVRGLAMKVLARENGDKLSDDPTEAPTQDFLSTDLPMPFGDNAAEFMDFAVANSQGKIALGEFNISHPEIRKKVTDALVRKQLTLASLLATNYWGGVPYRLGPGQAYKFIFKPTPGTFKKFPVSASISGYLGANLKKEIEKKGAQFDFYIQFQTDPVATPIEHALTEWTEDVSPPVKVGQVIIPAQPLTEDKNDYCQALRFNPWHHMKDHKPMGNMNRGRRFVYTASQNHRAAREEEPTLADVERVFGTSFAKVLQAKSKRSVASPSHSH